MVASPKIAENRVSEMGAAGKKEGRKERETSYNACLIDWTHGGEKKGRICFARDSLVGRDGRRRIG